MASIIGNWLGNQVFTTLFKTTYISLHTGDPGLTGTNPTEFVGGSYSRKRVTWSPASNKTSTNSNQVIFQNLPAASINYFGIWTAVANGNLMIRIPVAPGIVVGDGQQFFLQVADLAITL